MFPHSWHQATIIPIPKPGKDHTNPSNYRPIALTSCLCKLMEKLVNKRLMWFLETNKKISKFQSGFRKNRSTLDQLVRLETFIRNAFLKGEHVTVVFFDIEKAFDTTWKSGILRDLHSMGLRGNLPIFIKNFLQDRTFRTRIGTEYSDWYPQEQGVPQGSILSPILFEIKINSILDTLSKDVDGSLYVDDFIMAYKSGGKLDVSERHLQQQLKKLEKWADENGYRFSTSKTSVVHFCRQRKCMRKPELEIYGKRIEVKDEARFLGVIFDRKLSFLPHIKDLKRRCLQALNAFKIFCSPEWGGDTEILLQLYSSLIRSRLDYACQVYGSAKPSYLKMLDPIQNQGLRLAMGAYRTSPETSLQVEANMPPLDLRRKQLALQYAEKISSTIENPVYNCIFKTPKDIENLSKIKPSATKPFGLRIDKDLHELSFNPRNTEAFQFPTTPFWALKPVDVDLELTCLPKSSTSPDAYLKAFRNLSYQKYPDHEKIYTDGSKSDSAVACASVPMPQEMDEEAKALPADASIFTAEAAALDMALSAIGKSKRQKFVILSDSLSCLLALKAHEALDPRILKLKLKHNSLSLKGKSIVFTWIPSHVGIVGNDLADEFAKESLSMSVIPNTKLPYQDFKQKTKLLIRSEWAERWSKETRNKLHAIKPKIKPRQKLGLTRRDCVVYTRIKIGHSALTHRFLLSGDQKPFCVGCNTDFTIKHILTDCADFIDIRKRYYRCTKIKDIFDVVDPHRVLDFLREIQLYKRI